MKFAVFFALATDFNAIGRIDPQNLPTQTLMELLVSQVHNKEDFRDPKGDYTEYLSWPNVLTSPDGSVNTIAWEEMNLEGKMLFEYVPPTCESFFVDDCCVQGTVETDTLPAALRVFCVNANALSGTIDVAGFPATMSQIHLNINNFRGTLDFEKLPRLLTYFGVADNAFCDTVQLTQLPATLATLLLYQNQFSGNVDMRDLPASLVDFTLEENLFSQDVLRIGKISEAAYIFLKGNHFGKVYLADGSEVERGNSQVRI